MSEYDEELKRQQAEWKASEQAVSGEVKDASESVARSSFEEWCKLNGVAGHTGFELKSGMTILEKEQVYDAAFHEGQRKLMTELRDSHNDEVKLVDKLDLQSLKAELNALREQGNVQALGAKEAEIAHMFQQAISQYPYNMETCHMAEIQNKREMNCVGASVLGGVLLDEVGIKYLVGHIGNHVLLVIATSDGKVWWQDMQDGLERPVLENEELIADKMEGATPNDIASFANQPSKQGLKFSVKKDYWKDKVMTVLSPNIGLELQELISTGFVLGNGGRNDEAIEILELAKLKSPNDADVHLGLARAYKNKKAYGEAIAACSQALKIDPNSIYLKGVLDELRILSEAEMIGAGKEKHFFRNPENPDEAIGIYREGKFNQTPRQVRGRYYLNKILCLIFPNSIPEIHLSATKSPQLKTQYIEPDQLHKEFQQLKIKAHTDPNSITKADKRRGAEIDAERAADPNKIELEKKLKGIIWPFDGASINFAYDKKSGRMYYLDNDFTPWIIKRNGAIQLRFKRGALEKAIMELPGESREKALIYLIRLNKLKEEEGAEISKTHL